VGIFFLGSGVIEGGLWIESEEGESRLSKSISSVSVFRKSGIERWRVSRSLFSDNWGIGGKIWSIISLLGVISFWLFVISGILRLSSVRLFGILEKSSA